MLTTSNDTVGIGVGLTILGALALMVAGAAFKGIWDVRMDSANRPLLGGAR